MQTLILLREVLGTVPARLEGLSREKVEVRPSPGKWSPKEELGHLIDSAANNHQRIVRAQMERGLALPRYEQERWVAIHRYQDRDWDELIELWQAFNRQLIAAAEAVPASAWVNTLTIGGGEPVTLQFVFDDYLTHMVHHLNHIGIKTDDIMSHAA
jgi:hypothetical protein